MTQNDNTDGRMSATGPAGASSSHEAPAYTGSAKLDGRVALITGGDSGTGAAVAVLFAREGADVALVYLPEEREDAEHVRGPPPPPSLLSDPGSR